MSNKLITNSLSNSFMRFWNIGVVFIMTPVIIKNLGKHDYGIWEIVMSVVGYMGLLQFGVAPAIVRNVARYVALKDVDKLKQIYSSFLAIFTTIGILGSLIVAGWAYLSPGIIADDKMNVQKYALFLFIIACQVLLSFPGSVIRCFHEGYQRYNLVNTVNIIGSIIINSTLYYVLTHGGGLILFTLINVISSYIRTFVFWLFLSHSKYGGYHFKSDHINKKTILELYRFGLKSFLLGISDRIAFNTDSIVIGSFLGPAVVPFYVVPVNLVNKIKGIVMSITLGFMPHFSELDARGDTKEMIASFLIYSKYVTGITIVMLLGALFLGIPFINIWIGPEFGDKGRGILYIISIAFCLPLLNPFQGRVLTGMGRHGILAKIRLLAAVLNLVLSLILVQYWGILGVALWTLIPVVLTEPFIWSRVANFIGVRVYTYMEKVLFPQLVPLLASLLLYIQLPKYITISGYFSILANASICSAAYVILFLTFACTQAERGQIMRNFK